MTATDITTHNSQIRAAINEIADNARRGDEAVAQRARRTLDELCWSPDGYPTWVVAELDARGLRSTPS